MRLSLFERLLVLAGILSLALLLFPLAKHVRNRVFVRRIKVLEELMNSKLHCVFSFIGQPSVEICGQYKGRLVKFSSYVCGRVGLARVAQFTLTSSKLAKQSNVILDYVLVSENVRRVGDMLVYSNCGDFVSQRSGLGRARATQILEELIDAAERCEGRHGGEDTRSFI